MPVVLVTGLIGVSGLVAAGSGRDPLLTGFLGVFMTSVAVSLALSLRRVRGPWSRTTLDGRAAWRMRLGQPRVDVAAVALTVASLGVGLLTAAVVRNDAGGWILFGGLGGFLTVVALSLVLAVVRPPALVLGVDRVVQDGADVQASLPWAEVAETGLVVERRRAWVRLLATPHAAGLTWRRRRSWPLPWRRPPAPGVWLPLQQVADPARFLDLLRDLAQDRATRQSVLER